MALMLLSFSMGGLGRLLVPVVLVVIGGYVIALATRRDVLDAVERAGGRDRW